MKSFEAVYRCLDQAEQKLGESLSRMENKKFEYQVDGQKRPMSITVSYGLAECGMQDSQEQLTGRADQKMYDAKNRRKNHVSSGPNSFQKIHRAAGR